MKKLLLVFTFTFGLLYFSFAQQGLIQLPATGQTTSYYPGDDGDLQMGVAIPANRFTDNGDGFITDSFTGLMWAKDANLIASRDPSFDQDRTPGDGDINWTTALDYIEKLNTENYLGYNDWRMPNCLELQSLLNLENDSLTLPGNHPFTNLKAGYWSSTTSERLKGNSIAVYLSKYVVHANTTYPAGHFESLNKNLGPTIGYFVLYLLPVRDGVTNGDIEIPQSGQTINYYQGDDGGMKTGTAWPSPRLVDNKNGSVNDRLTGLMWTTNTDLMYSRDPGFDTCGNNPDGMVTWETALGYVYKLNTENYLGHNDWRLPNRNELCSLIDYSRNSLCMPKNHPFTAPSIWGEIVYSFWSSSTIAGNPDKAWLNNFWLSNLYYYEKSYEMAVWPVRTDNAGLPSGAINGTIEGAGLPKKGIEITLEGAVNARTETNVDGYYKFDLLPDGNYIVTPSDEYFAFTPQQKSVNVSGTAESCDFAAAYNRAYGWKNISAGLYPLENASGAGLRYIYFINDDEGWIASNVGFYHTTDGGLTFETQTLPIEGDFSSAVYMFNENEGYAGSAGGVIYHTTNGGDDWTILGFTGQWVLDVSFPPNSTTGFCSGANGSFWEISPDGMEQIVTGSNLDLRISTPTVGHTFIGASPHRLWHYDGNEIVDCCTMGGGSGGIHFHNDTMGWLSKKDGGIDGSGGIGISNCLRLKPSDDTIQYSFNDVHSPNGKDVWVVGNPGVIWYSPNGNDFIIDPPIFKSNTIWYQQAAGLTNDYLQAVFFTSPTNGYASGSNGTLLKYTQLPGAPLGADILGVKFPGQFGKEVIDMTDRTISVEVADSIDITYLVPEIYTSAEATIDPPSGVGQDFTNPVTYNITSFDGITKTWEISVASVFGIESPEAESSEILFSIHPNPANDRLYITLNSSFLYGCNLELLDLNGRKLLEKQITAGTESVEIVVSGLESGIYFCKVITEEYSATKKLIIQP